MEDKLLEKVALRRGWTNIHIDTWWEESFNDIGEVHGYIGYSSSQSLLVPIPRYTSDLSAAMQLFFELPESSIAMKGGFVVLDWHRFTELRYRTLTCPPQFLPETIAKAWLEEFGGMVE